MGGRELEVHDKGQVHDKRVLEGRKRVLVHGKVLGQGHGRARVLVGHMVQEHGMALAHGKLGLEGHREQVWVGGRVLELKHKKKIDQ